MVPRTLLVVDDDPTLEGRVQDALPVCRIVAAGGVADALEAVRAHRPPVVALSVDLAQLAESPNGGGDGLDALSLILGEAPSIKVIALAPHDQRVLAVRAVARGAPEGGGKPSDAQELAGGVQRAFQRADLELEGRRLAIGDAPPTLRVLRDETERRALLDTLARPRGNPSGAGGPRWGCHATPYSLLRQHGIRAD
ncbi:response regulator [Azospirillum brasilense]|nr:response regulator [Azospirillum brasilense]